MQNHVLAMWFFDLYNMLFNFWDKTRSNVRYYYKVFKYQYFDNKILKLGYLNTATGRYYKVYDIDHPIYIVFYRLMIYLGWKDTLLDYNYLNQYQYNVQDSILVARFIKDNTSHSVITNKSIDGYFEKKIICDPFLYCTLDDTTDLTHVFSEFLHSIHYNSDGLKCKWYVNALCEFAGIKRGQVQNNDESVLKYMLDDDNYEEKIFKDNDIILLK